MKFAAKLQIGNDLRNDLNCLLCFRCIRGLLKSKVCILVSHQLQYLNDSDSILCLHEVSIMGINTVSAAHHLGIVTVYCYHFKVFKVSF